MTLTGDEYGRRTLEFVERLQQSSSPEEICRLLATELEWFGLSFMTSFHIPGPGEDPGTTVDVNTRPADYIEHYIAKNYVTRDPLVTHLRYTVLPFTWNDVRATRRLSKPDRFIIDEAKDFGATDGMVIPVLSENGVLGLFCPCGDQPNLSPRARAAIEIIGIYGYHALRRAAAQTRLESQLRTPLTRREREVLKWVATGKSDDEIADILTIGRETVTTHIENAKRKLNARRRTYAVIQALRYGELSL